MFKSVLVEGGAVLGLSRYLEISKLLPESEEEEKKALWFEWLRTFSEEEKELLFHELFMSPESTLPVFIEDWLEEKLVTKAMSMQDPPINGSPIKETLSLMANDVDALPPDMLARVSQAPRADLLRELRSFSFSDILAVLSFKGSLTRRLFRESSHTRRGFAHRVVTEADSAHAALISAVSFWISEDPVARLRLAKHIHSQA